MCMHVHVRMCMYVYVYVCVWGGGLAYRSVSSELKSHVFIFKAGVETAVCDWSWGGCLCWWLVGLTTLSDGRGMVGLLLSSLGL